MQVYILFFLLIAELTIIEWKNIEWKNKFENRDIDKCSIIVYIHLHPQIIPRCNEGGHNVAFLTRKNEPL